MKNKITTRLLSLLLVLAMLVLPICMTSCADETEQPNEDISNTPDTPDTPTEKPEDEKIVYKWKKYEKGECICIRLFVCLFIM